MTIAEWQQLTPREAAHALHARVRERLTPAQQRAVLAILLAESDLAAEFERARATGGPLRGVPVLVKDLFDVAGLPTKAGSTFLGEIRQQPTQDSSLVARLRERGAAIAGKTQLHEFAYGITGENPHYGDCERPGFPGRTSGGSSSGSAAAVAAGIVPIALGTDTGGSVRVPAAFCGIYGMRLMPDHPWIRDAVKLAPSFDTPGWLAASAEDLACVNHALLGDTRTENRALRGWYLKSPDAEPAVAKACADAVATICQPMPAAIATSFEQACGGLVDAYNLMVAAEAWTIHATWAERWRERYDPAVWQRLQRGRQLAPEELGRAREKVAQVCAVWDAVFRECDFVVLPATPFGALTKAECTLTNRNRLLALTTPASVAGLPALTIPLSLPSGLTSGLQVIAPAANNHVLGVVLEIWRNRGGVR